MFTILCIRKTPMMTGILILPPLQANYPMVLIKIIRVIYVLCVKNVIIKSIRTTSNTCDSKQQEAMYLRNSCFGKKECLMTYTYYIQLFVIKHQYCFYWLCMFIFWLIYPVVDLVLQTF